MDRYQDEYDRPGALPRRPGMAAGEAPAFEDDPGYLDPVTAPVDRAAVNRAAADYRAEPREHTLRGEEQIELREEELVARREVRKVGEVHIQTHVDEVPAELDVDSSHEEIDIQHVPVNEAVSERRDPWEEDGVLVVPVYEEQQVVVKRLVLREHLRIRRVRVVERQHFQDTLKRERLEIDDPNQTGMVRERYPEADPEADRQVRWRGDRAADERMTDRDAADRPAQQEGGTFLENLAKRVLQ